MLCETITIIIHSAVYRTPVHGQVCFIKDIESVCLFCTQGQRPDETLDVNLKLPFAPGSSGAAKSATPKPAASSAVPGPAAPQAAAGTAAALLGKRRAGLGALLPMPRFGGAAAPPSLLPHPTAAAAADTPAAAGDNQQGGNFVLRCGQLLMSAEVLEWSLHGA